VKYLVDQEHVRALVKAPMYSYVVDRLGPDVLQPVYARWYGFFVEYGSYLNTAYEHAKTSAVKAGAPRGLHRRLQLRRQDDALAGRLQQ
jgi:hypothetical protein